MRCLIASESKTSGRARSQATDHGRGMKPAKLQTKAEAPAGQFYRHLIACDESPYQVEPAVSLRIGKREQRSPRHRADVRVRRNMRIVEIKRMRRHTIQQS